MRPRTRASAADRCVGAQYVASIVTGAVGGLVSAPQAGAPMLFAYLGADGRIGVVRTGPLVRFEDLMERITLKPDDEEEARSGAYASYAARSASSTELFDEDDDGGTTLARHETRHETAPPVRPPAPPWPALRRAGMRLEPPRPVRNVRDSAPTWKNVQPPRPRSIARVVVGKR